MRGVLPEALPTVCPYCEIVYARKRGNQKFCSKECKNRYYERKRGPRSKSHEHQCGECGKPFVSRSNGATFCSQSCSATNKWRLGKIPAVPSGADSPQWLGGAKASLLRRKYGLTLERYEALLAAQKESCAICGKECPSGKALGVDHDHATGEIRGLLCSPCNIGLGSFRDDPQRLEVAIRYLQAPPSRTLLDIT